MMIAATPPREQRTSQLYCTFWVGDQHYGIEVENVREVRKSQRTTPVPTSTSVIGGLINLRGDIVTAIDLRRRLDLPPANEDVPSMSVVVSLGDEVISLVVDAVGDVVDLPLSELQPVPATVPVAVREVMTGVYRLPQGLVQVLDASQLVPIDNTEGA